MLHDIGKSFTPDTDHERDRGKVQTPKIDYKIDLDKCLVSKVRSLEKSTETGKNRKNQEIYFINQTKCGTTKSLKPKRRRKKRNK